ncbi:hypothetical protein [Sanguibacter suaedae]|uniref:Uncharacterized protein n=1 Tax=Sanguibacter suaedae TaxID=2795737 RepID=A0A934I856_9MICO|nr:hypothetical protein [Sanguibacter suaedae]MBI9115996.1 hypothetical protein [Sanguibacter suaedae]
MNHDLRRSLHDLADTGADHATPAPAFVGSVTDRVARTRRHRPYVIAAATTAGVLTASAAAALGYSFLSDSDRPAFPDRITPGHGTESPSETPSAPVGSVVLECGQPVGDVQPYSTPLNLETELAAEGDGPWSINPQAASIIPTYLTNTTSQTLTLTLEENAGVYLVQDGAVVAEPVRGAVDAPDATLEPDGRHVLVDDRVVMCDGTVDVPAGDYEAYSALEVTIGDGPWAGTDDVVGGPWPVTVAAPDAGVELAELDPSAAAPQCGAAITDQRETFRASTGADLATVQPAAEGVDVPLTIGNPLFQRFSGTVPRPTLVAVRDGVVVGALPVEDPPVEPFDMEALATTETSGRLSLLACGPGGAAGPLPEGRYEVWVHQPYRVTSRTEPDRSGYGGEGMRPVDETHTIQMKAGYVWIDAEGASVPTPLQAAGWPRALDTMHAFLNPGTGQSVVWLSFVEDEAARASLRELGYPDTPIPGYCQPGVGDETSFPNINEAGIGVAFTDPADAAAFADLYEGTVAAVVDLEVYCIID